ncbi:MAG: hypothetical protein WBZ07_07270 [Candidatus Dormiibacterota bacterium]
MGFKDLYKSLDEKGKAVAADLQAKAAEKAPMIDAKIAAAKEAAAAATARANEYGKEHGLGNTGGTPASSPASPPDPVQTDAGTGSAWVPPGVGQPGEEGSSQ